MTSHDNSDTPLPFFVFQIKDAVTETSQDVNAMQTARIVLQKGTSDILTWAEASQKVSEWWNRRTEPHAWRQIAAIVFAYTLTSASVENYFHSSAQEKTRGRGREDGQQASAMAWHNGRWFSTTHKHENDE